MVDAHTLQYTEINICMSIYVCADTVLPYEVYGRDCPQMSLLDMLVVLPLVDRGTSQE